MMIIFELKKDVSWWLMDIREVSLDLAIYVDICKR